MSKSKENWKFIPGFNKFYEVSDLGNVRSYRTRRTGQRATRPTLLSGGITRTTKGYFIPYRYVLLTDSKGKAINKKRAHLVLLAFVGKKPDGYDASHLNGDSFDDRLTNLKWESRQNNIARISSHRQYRIPNRYTLDDIKTQIKNRNVNTKRLTEQEVADIKLYLSQGATELELACEFNTSYANIKNIAMGITFKNVKPTLPRLGASKNALNLLEMIEKEAIKKKKGKKRGSNNRIK